MAFLYLFLGLQNGPKVDINKMYAHVEGEDTLVTHYTLPEHSAGILVFKTTETTLILFIIKLGIEILQKVAYLLLASSMVDRRRHF